jgi:hypothetical protein
LFNFKFLNNENFGDYKIQKKDYFREHTLDFRPCFHRDFNLWPATLEIYHWILKMILIFSQNLHLVGPYGPERLVTDRQPANTNGDYPGNYK